MSIHSTFPGGIHPSENKHTSKDSVTTLAMPKQLVIPVSQHIGAPAKAEVNVGDEVVPWQKIASSGGFVSADIHTPLAGKVTAVGNFPHPMGQKAQAIVIEVAETQGEAQPYHDKNMDQLDSKELVSLIASAGIVGMGGATFPAHVKLSPPPGTVIDTVILNGVECEPYLTSDHRVMLEYPEEIIAGLKIILKILGAKTGIIGIEKNKEDAIQLMSDKVKNEENISVLPLTVKYPQGAEKQLIYAATGRQVPSGGLPMAVGCVVQNVGTAQAIFRALTLGEPLMQRVVTLGGSLINKPGNYMVPVGMLVSELVEMAGGLKEDPYRIIMGGPMMGMAISSLDVPVIKGTSGILFLAKSEVKDVETHPCISCGSCVTICPMWLTPCELARYADKRKHQECLDLGLMDCVECGSCAYVCPSGLPLVHAFKTEKALSRTWQQGQK